MSNRKKPVVLGFFHTWDKNKILQSPYHSIVSTFESLGVELKIIWTSELVPADVYTFSKSISENKMIRFIEKLNPLFILSINNGGMTKKIRNSVKCPVVKWLFDDFPHLFFHDGIASVNEGFWPDDIVITYTSSLAGRVETQYPFLKGRTHFLPHATDTALLSGIPWNPKYNISFVGSCLDIEPTLRLVSTYGQIDPKVSRAILKAIEILRKDYYCDIQAVIKELELEKALAREQINWLHFKRLISDVVSTQDRIDGITAVNPLGLALFGGINWLSPLLFGTSVSNCYQFEEKINTQSKLTQVYQNSKISIDLPNIQNSNSLSGRVIDVMASGSLLITQYQEKSDAYKIFGKNCPIPMYKTTAHLKELCTYYLSHEEERLAIVKQCNELVSIGFSFNDRVRKLFSILNLESTLNDQPTRAQFIQTNKFNDYLSFSYWYKTSKFLFYALIGKIVPRFAKHAIIRSLS